MLLWASKFATAKIEWSFERCKYNIFEGNIYFAADGLSTGSCVTITQTTIHFKWVFRYSVNPFSHELRFYSFFFFGGGYSLG